MTNRSNDDPNADYEPLRQQHQCEQKDQFRRIWDTMGKLNGAVKWPHMIAVLTILTTVTLFMLAWISAIDGKAFDRTEDMRKERMGQYERLAEKLNQVVVNTTRIETQQTTLMKEFRKDRNET